MARLALAAAVSANLMSAVAGKKQRGGHCPGIAPFIDIGVAALCEGNFPREEDPPFRRWIVHFHGSECRRCREAALALREAAQRRDGVQYGAVDCHHAQNANLCKRQGAWKLPLIKSLARGERYSGPLEALRLHEWAVAATGAEIPLPPQGSGPTCPLFRLYDEPRVAKEFLRAHNVYRCVAGLEHLEWDSKLFTSAKRWAARAPLNLLQHSPEDLRRGPGGVVLGENIALGEEPMQPGQVVARWHAEIRNTQGGRVPSQARAAGVGHYTQLVWRSTRRVGCSLAQNRRAAVCHYFPPGNEKGRYITQVAPPWPGYAGLDGEVRCGGPVESICA